MVWLGQIIEPIAFADLMAQLFLVVAAVFTEILEIPLVALDVLRMPLTMLAAALFHSKVIKKPAKHSHTVTVLPTEFFYELANVCVLCDAAPSTVKLLS